MTFQKLLAFTAVLTFSAAAADFHSELLGTYRIIQGERNGQPIPSSKFQEVSVRIADNIITTYDKDEKEVYVATYRLDSSAVPTKIHMTAKKAPRGGAGTVSNGVIARNGDNVRLVYALPGGPTPTQFATRQGQQMFLLQRTAQPVSSTRTGSRMMTTQSNMGAQSLSLAEARQIIAAAERRATSINQPMNIAVVDQGGNLVAQVRMDGAWMGSIDIATDKAWTSRAFDIETRSLAQASQPGQRFYGIQVSNQGRVMIFPGGIPLKRNGVVIGAIGVSGGNNEQDQSVAEAGAAAMPSMISQTRSSSR